MHEKQAVALTSVLGALVLTALKIVVGISTGSLGILSEAAHSGLDLIAAIVTLFAVRTSSKPADPDHTYGHGKIENLSALFETLLLLVTCVWIVGEAYERLFVKWVPVDATIWSFGVILVSIGIDISRSRALRRVAKKYKSQALEADALHFTTDIWSSLVVLLGLGGVLLSKHLGVPWLAKADAVAAVGVALIVIWVSVELGKKTINDLLDAVHPELQRKIMETAARVGGVMKVDRVRVRKAGAETFADLTVYVARELPLEMSHRIADQVESEIKKILEHADIVIHVEPFGKPDESLIASIRLLSARYGLAAHEIIILNSGLHNSDAISVDLHLEVDHRMKLFQAHNQVSAFERELTQLYPSIHQITTQIEPNELIPGSAERTPVPRHSAEGTETRVRSILDEIKDSGALKFKIHFLKAQSHRSDLSVLLHLACTPDSSITEVHQLTLSIKQLLHHKLPEISRIVIHTEPA